MAALHYNQTSGFEAIHGLLDRTMELLEVNRVDVGDQNGYYIKGNRKKYWQKQKRVIFFSAGSEKCYFPGRSADIFLWGEKIGSMGVVHPDTLKAFELPNPVSVLELNLEPFLWTHLSYIRCFVKKERDFAPLGDGADFYHLKSV